MQLVAGSPVLLASIAWVKPLWTVAVGAVAVVAVLFAVLWILDLLASKVAAIARTTAKEAISQPLFYVLLLIGVAALLIFPFIPYNTFGEDIKMLKAEGLTLIKILAIILAVWTAGMSISEELEGRTALTLLSKPISRRQFILGKFLGVVGPVAILFVILGSLFLSSVSYKVVYDAREAASTAPESIQCQAEMAQIVPGLVLSFMEAVVLASISVAISTRLPILANLVICVSIYVLGHLVPMLVESALGQFAIVGFVGHLLAAVLPGLVYFNMETAISTGQTVPAVYVLAMAGYCLLYSTVAMLLALLLFEDRDLA
ncbi:MAG: ABC transporter permease subunit [Planctomycetes bacterium]|nr:ABC transporter permease subunit [Planctomycetota bacterium]